MFKLYAEGLAPFIVHWNVHLSAKQLADSTKQPVKVYQVAKYLGDKEVTEHYINTVYPEANKNN